MPIRFSGNVLTMSATIFPGVTVRVASVSIGPGAMALTRMFMPPTSWASCWVRPLIPTFARP